MVKLIPGRNDPYREGWSQAVELARWIDGGGELPTQASSVVLYAGEVVHCTVEAELAGLYGQDVEYGGGSFIGFGSVGMMAATAGASALWNRRQRKKAEAQAATQWRGFGTQWVTLSSHRLLFPVDGQLVEYGLDGGIAAFEPQWQDFHAIVHGAGAAPVAMRGPAVPYLSVILSHYLFGNVPPLT